MWITYIGSKDVIWLYYSITENPLNQGLQTKVHKDISKSSLFIERQIIKKCHLMTFNMWSSSRPDAFVQLSLNVIIN